MALGPIWEAWLAWAPLGPLVVKGKVLPACLDRARAHRATGCLCPNAGPTDKQAWGLCWLQVPLEKCAPAPRGGLRLGLLTVAHSSPSGSGGGWPPQLAPPQPMPLSTEASRQSQEQLVEERNEKTQPLAPGKTRKSKGEQRRQEKYNNKT